MKKYFSILIAIIAAFSFISASAQSHRITAKPGDTIVVGGTAVIAKPNNGSVVQRPRKNHYHRTGYLVQRSYPFKSVDSSKMVSDYYRGLMANQNNYNNNLLTIMIIVVAAILILAVLAVWNRTYNYHSYPANGGSTHQTFNVNGGTSTSYGGRSESSVINDSEIREKRTVIESFILLPEEEAKQAVPAKTDEINDEPKV